MKKRVTCPWCNRLSCPSQEELSPSFEAVQECLLARATSALERIASVLERNRADARREKRDRT